MEDSDTKQLETDTFLLKIGSSTHKVEGETVKFLLKMGASKYKIEGNDYLRLNPNLNLDSGSGSANTSYRIMNKPTNYAETERTLIPLSDWLKTNSDQVYNKSTAKNKRRQDQTQTQTQKKKKH